MKKKILDKLVRADRWLCLHLRPWRLRIWWHELWIRENEQHPSLNIDINALTCMDDQQRETYESSLIWRRQEAHERDNKRADAELRSRRPVATPLS